MLPASRIDCRRGAQSRFRMTLAGGLAAAIALTGVQSRALAQTAPADGWQFEASSYAWLIGLDGTVGVGEIRVDVNDTFLDLLEQSDELLGVMLHGEAQYGGFGIVGDFAYARIGANELGRTRADAVVTMMLAELGGTRALAGWTSTGNLQVRLDALGGARFTRISADLETVAFGDGDREKSWVDPFVGLRATIGVGDSWVMRLRGDVGGFGVGSDFSWQAIGTIAYRFTLFGAEAQAGLGYRALYQDYSSHSFRWDMTVHGPLVGLRLVF